MISARKHICRFRAGREGTGKGRMERIALGGSETKARSSTERRGARGASNAERRRTSHADAETNFTKPRRRRRRRPVPGVRNSPKRDACVATAATPTPPTSRRRRPENGEQRTVGKRKRLRWFIPRTAKRKSRTCKT